MSRLLLIFNQLVAGSLPLHLLLLEIVCELLLLLHQAHYSAIEQFHDMIAKLSCHDIRFRLKIVDLSDSKLYVIKGFSQLVLVLLLTFKHSVDFSLDLARFLDKFAIESIA